MLARALLADPYHPNALSNLASYYKEIDHVKLFELFSYQLFRVANDLPLLQQTEALLVQANLVPSSYLFKV